MDILRTYIVRFVRKIRQSSILFQNSDTGFLYAESKRARLAREKEEKERQQMMEQQQERQPEIEFAPEDLALATIPGANFDPRERAFSTEELKPQPIIRKRKKVRFVEVFPLDFA